MKTLSLNAHTERISYLMRVCLLLLGMAGPAFGASSAIRTPAQGEAKQGLVLQVSDANPATWQLALNNARNIQGVLGANQVTVEIVAYGPGLNMLKFDSPVGPGLNEALHSGVKLMACGKTMRAQKLTVKDLYPGIRVVRAGVLEIMEKQRMGYGYIRP